MSDRMDQQSEEFKAASKLAEQTRRHSMTAVIDDDYPEVRHDYEVALRLFLDACFNNRRILPVKIPRIVCLCGSTRFYREYQLKNYELTMVGEIVLTVGHYPHADAVATGQYPNGHGEQVGCTPEQKAKLDELHKRKIDLCDYVYVINKDGYIGDSTRSEIAYANKIGRPVEYMEISGIKIRRNQ